LRRKRKRISRLVAHEPVVFRGCVSVLDGKVASEVPGNDLAEKVLDKAVFLSQGQVAERQLHDASTVQSPSPGYRAGHRDWTKPCADFHLRGGCRRKRIEREYCPLEANAVDLTALSGCQPST
jgi:hypothetical protein